MLNFFFVNYNINAIIRVENFLKSCGNIYATIISAISIALTAVYMENSEPLKLVDNVL